MVKKVKTEVKTNQTTQKTMGRKLIELNEEEVLKLASIGCTVQEIADWFGVSKDVLERRFQGSITEGWTKVKMSLRRAQLKTALQNENPTMQIWLGKQLLGQREPKQEIDFSTGTDGIDFVDDTAA